MTAAPFFWQKYANKKREDFFHNFWSSFIIIIINSFYSKYYFQIFDYAQYYLDLADANRKVAEANMKEGNGGLDSINR